MLKRTPYQVFLARWFLNTTAVIFFACVSVALLCALTVPAPTALASLLRPWIGTSVLIAISLAWANLALDRGSWRVWDRSADTHTPDWKLLQK